MCTINYSDNWLGKKTYIEGAVQCLKSHIINLRTLWSSCLMQLEQQYTARLHYTTTSLFDSAHLKAT